MHIASPDEDEIDNAIIVLHDCGGKETDLMALHKKHLRQPKTVYLYPRGPYQALSGNFSWAEQGKHFAFSLGSIGVIACWVFETTDLKVWFIMGQTGIQMRSSQDVPETIVIVNSRCSNQQMLVL